MAFYLVHDLKNVRDFVKISVRCQILNKNRTKSIKVLLVGIFQNSIRGRKSGKKCNPNLEKVTRILLFFFPEQKIKFGFGTQKLFY